VGVFNDQPDQTLRIEDELICGGVRKN